MLKKQQHILLEKYKTIYLVITKNASSSIKSFIVNNLDIGEFKPNKLIDKFPYISISQVLEKDNYFSFSFVRNPYSRIVSSYMYLIFILKERSRGKIWKGYDDIIKDCNFNIKITFKEFIFNIYRNNFYIIEPHTIPQYMFITDREKKIIPKYIGQVENFKEDFKYICNKIGIKKGKMFHLNKLNEKKDLFYYRKYYDINTFKIVTKMYEEDIDLFNYKF